MRYGIHTLDDFDVYGKVVLCRVDINSPLDSETGACGTRAASGAAPRPSGNSRRTGARVVLWPTRGGTWSTRTTPRPSRTPLFSVSFLAARGLRRRLCGPAARDAIRRLGNGEVLLLDNVRFVAEELTLFETKLNLTPAQQAKTLVVRKLAPLGDLFVCDAFAAVHRSQPSLVGFEEVLPSAMGRLFEQEYSSLSHLRADPERPCVFVLGGTKVDDAFL